MRIIDFHTHAFPDGIAERALDSLARNYGRTPSFDGTIAGLLRRMDADGVDISVVLPVAMKQEQVRSINDWIVGIREDRIVPFGALHPDYPDLYDEVTRLLDAGIRGVKLQPNWQNFSPDDERAFPMYEAAEGRIMLYFHSGDEFRGDLPLLSTPETIAEVHRRFPGLRLGAAHMGGFLMWDGAQKLIHGQDICLDMSFCGPDYLDEAELARFIRSHGAHRVVFGSDAPAGDAVLQRELLERLDITPEEREAVAWRTATQMLGLEG